MSKHPLRRLNIVALLLAAIIIGGLLVPGLNRLALNAAAAGVYDSETIADVAEKAAPAVVGVTATLPSGQEISPDIEEFFKYFNLDPPKQTDKEQINYGTGFIFRADGHILTNAHLMAGAVKVSVTLQDGTKLAAKVIGISNLLDLAVLKVEAGRDLPYLPMGDSAKLRPGQWVIAIGNPFGYDHSVTAGVISALDRRVPVPDKSGQMHMYENLLQTDAAINPGNSGGPLLDLDGRVVGINSVVNAGAQGIGFAIPINTARDALDELIATGRFSRPWLGVSIIDLETVDQETRDRYKLPAGPGVFVVEVVPNSPADLAGLVQGDAIVKLDGKPIHDAAGLVAAIRRHKTGDQIKISVIHRGKEIEFKLTLTETPDA